MKHVLNFFGSLCCFIIGFIVATLLFALTTMNSTEFLVKENIVKNLIVDIDVKDLVGESSYQEINDLLEKSGIPKEYVDYVVENEDIKEYLGEYASTAIDSVLYEKDLPKIDEKQLTDLLINSFDAIVESVNKNEINVDKKVTDKDIKKVHDTINEYVPKIVKEIPDIEELIGEELEESAEYQETRENINQLTDGIELVKKAYSQKYVLVIMIVVGLALIVLMKSKSPKLINWLWRPFVTACVLCTLVVVECKTLLNYFYPEQLNFLRKFVDNNIGRMCDIYKRDTIIYLVIIILLIVAKIVMIVLKNKKENKQLAIDNPSKEESSKVEETNEEEINETDEEKEETNDTEEPTEENKDMLDK